MNKSHKDVECINFETQQFLAALSKFRDSTNAIDRTLCNNLLDVVSEIENFLSSKPVEIESATVEQLTPANLDEFGVYKAFICRECGVEFGDSLQSVRDHLASRHRHPRMRNNVLGINDSRPRQKKKSPQQPNKRALPKSNYFIGNNYDNKDLTDSLPPEVKSLILDNMSEFFENRMNVAEKLINLQQYNTLETDLLSIVRTVYPGVPIKSYFFGSRMSGIGNINSDLDIFVDIDNVFQVYENRPSKLTISKVEEVGEALSRSDTWERFACIRNARVPIIRAHHNETQLNCDIGFSNSLGFCNTKLLRYFLELQPIAKAMVIFLKHWYAKAKIVEGPNNYTTTLLVIAYLQTKKMLPSVKELQDCLEEHLEVGPWLASFAEKSLAELNLAPAPQCYLSSFKREMRDFFAYYADYNFLHHIVCPYLGEPITKKKLESDPRLERYVNLVKAHPTNMEIRFKKTVMMIQDPFEMNNNTSKGVSDACLERIQHYFLLSAELITNHFGTYLDSK